MELFASSNVNFIHPPDATGFAMSIYVCDNFCIAKTKIVQVNRDLVTLAEKLYSWLSVPASNWFESGDKPHSRSISDQSAWLSKSCWLPLRARIASLMMRAAGSHKKWSHGCCCPLNFTLLCEEFLEWLIPAEKQFTKTLLPLCVMTTRRAF